MLLRIHHVIVLVVTALSLVAFPGVALGAAQGIAVLGAGPSRDNAFVLARAVYASRLRPASVDEAHARVLAGEAPAENAPSDLRDLAALREAISGDDAPSRRLLASIAQQLGVSALLVVTSEQNVSKQNVIVARLFLADDGEFDAARYEPDPASTGPRAWQKVIFSLERRFDATPRQLGAQLSAQLGAPGISGTSATSNAQVTPSSAPSAAVHAIPLSPVKPHGDSKPFYVSPWFWSAVGAAVLLGGGIYLLSRDTNASQVHLRMYIPQ